MLSPRAHPPDWSVDGEDWPNRKASRFVTCAGSKWHVQIMGDDDAPVVLLVHGTGAATHSFRDLLQLLSETYRVVAFDLPGHGFTQASDTSLLSLPGMARAIAMLLRQLELVPTLVVGHSAGAAILIEMTLRKQIDPQRIIGINSALMPIEGHAILSPMAKLLFANPFVPRLVSFRAQFGDLAGKLLTGTGSPIDAVGKRCYAMLLKNPTHISGALGMMANWDLKALSADLPRLATPITLIAAKDDRTVPASVSSWAAKRIPGAELLSVSDGGHLLHEVRPDFIAQLIRDRGMANMG